MATVTAQAPRVALPAALKHRAVQSRTIGHPAQLGAAAVIAPGGEIVWRHLAEDAADNAAPDEILRAAAAIGAR